MSKAGGPRGTYGPANDAPLQRRIRDRDPAALERLWDEIAAGRPGWRRYRLDWLASRRPGAAPLAAATPWVTFPALDWLRRSLPRAARVFEWGCGGSTLFFARRVALLISVEHDRDWHQRVAAALEETKAGPVEQALRFVRYGAVGCRMVTEHVPAEPTAEPAPEPYRSGRAELAGLSLERYVRRIEAWPDGSFDLVLVDGRARPGCVAAAIPKVAPGGAILLDNADYPRYAPALDRLRKNLLAGWRELDLTGPGPFSTVVGWGAILWQRTGRAAPG